MITLEGFIATIMDDMTCSKYLDFLHQTVLALKHHHDNQKANGSEKVSKVLIGTSRRVNNKPAVYNSK